ncbi:MAG: HEAT repeat domain-containing protein [Chloroflexi bacterium]|nr:HEAT repeat domain-containing protein [Chloroflexota bacterium]
MNRRTKTINFTETLDQLRADAPITADAIYSLSDLMDDNWADFQLVWPNLPAERRRHVIDRLVDTAETNFELDFGPIVHLALADPDLEVRLRAIEGVLEESDLPTVRRLLTLAQEDTFSEVRAAAVKALGVFVLQGELGKLPERFSQELQEAILEMYNNLSEDLDVRRRALEAIANCGHGSVPELIREAYYADDLLMRVSAVFAMGRSCDERWQPQVLEELASEYPELRYEAARAAGELELSKALPQLIELAYEGDREIQEVSIWAMGEIGGQLAQRALDQLASQAEQIGDDALIEAIQDAQAAATLAGEGMLPLFDFGNLEDQELDDLTPVDLDDLNRNGYDEDYEVDEFEFDDDYDDYN